MVGEEKVKETAVSWMYGGMWLCHQHVVSGGDHMR